MKFSSFTGFRLVLVAAAIVLAFSGMAMGEMLFSDSYDTSVPSSDVNFEIDSRTGGTYGGSGSITYNSFVNNGASKTVGLVDGSREVLQFDTPYTRDPSAARNYLWLDHNFNGADSAGGLDVGITAKIDADDTSGTGKWYAVSFANDSSAASDDTNRPLMNGVTFLFRPNGTGSVYQNRYTTLGSFAWVGGEDYHDLFFEIRGADDDNPFDDTGRADITLYVDGSSIGTYTTTSTYSTANNYIGLEGIEGVSDGDNTKCYFDNLTINKIPEPSTLALLATGLIGLLAYAWRKRK